MFTTFQGSGPFGIWPGLNTFLHQGDSIIITNTITYGDGYADQNPKDILFTIFFDYYWGDDSDGTFSDDNEIEVYCNHLCQPEILTNDLSIFESGLARCCDDPILFWVDELCDANNLEWDIQGAGFQANGNEVTVFPSPYDPFSIAFEVRRNESAPEYSRSTSINIERVWPQMPPIISNEDYICVGEPIILWVEPVCGMDAIQWDLPNGTEIVEERDFSISIVVLDENLVGTDLIITATGTSGNDCIIEGEVTIEIPIYISEIPPSPNGFIGVGTCDGEPFNPCGPTGLCFEWITNSPYSNGTTTISPPIYWIQPHNQNPVNVTVCNENICSGEESCVQFEIQPPEPCDPLLHNQNNELEDPNLSTGFEVKKEVITSFNLFPNPSNGQITIHFPKDFLGHSYIIFDINGKPIQNSQIINNQITNVRINKSGLFILKAYSDKQMITKKFQTIIE